MSDIKIEIFLDDFIKVFQLLVKLTHFLECRDQTRILDLNFIWFELYLWPPRMYS